MNARSQASLLGFDIVRLAATATVAAGHWWSIHASANDRPLNVGPMQASWLGVAALLGVSGYLAFGPGDRSASAWFWRRATRIYPVYWATLALVFAANAYLQRHPVTTASASAHVAGIAAFTHPDMLLATHLWFVSLILACYAIAALGRCWESFVPIAATAILALQPYGSSYAAFFGCFFAGGLMRRFPGWVAPVFAVAVGLTLAYIRHADYLCIPIAVTAVVAARVVRRRSPAPTAAAAHATYEFYLLHPLAYLLGAETFQLSREANLVVGTAIAFAATAAFAIVGRRMRSWTTARHTVRAD
jgi:peptidoglycan/LPS O-acetylase OafA/YrhL